MMLNELMERYPCLAVCREDLETAARALIACYERGGRVFTCGNGGSCADADHIVGELMKGFLKKRPLSEEKRKAMLTRCPDLTEETLGKLQGALPALSLCSLTALNTAFCNDVDPALMYAQSILGLGREGDVLICLSTSGNAANVHEAAQVASGLGLTVIGLTGQKGGKLRETANICIRVPETETFKVQELHLPVYHYLCAAVEAHFFTE